MPLQGRARRQTRSRGMPRETARLSTLPVCSGRQERSGLRVRAHRSRRNDSLHWTQPKPAGTPHEPPDALRCTACLRMDQPARSAGQQAQDHVARHDCSR
jgi:hypothetical protein